MRHTESWNLTRDPSIWLFWVIFSPSSWLNTKTNVKRLCVRIGMWLTAKGVMPCSGYKNPKSSHNVCNGMFVKKWVSALLCRPHMALGGLQALGSTCGGWWGFKWAAESYKGSVLRWGAPQTDASTAVGR